MPRQCRRRHERPTRKRKRDPPQCPCGCGATDLSDRTKYYHLAGRGLPVADTEADHRDDVCLEPRLDVVPGAGDDVEAGGGEASVNAGAGIDQHWGIPDEFMSDMRRVVGVLTLGALVTLVMALQLRHHLANTAADAMCQLAVCVSLATLPLTRLKRAFARMFYPSATMVQFCANECVGRVGLGANSTCPGCGEQMTDSKGTPAHVSHLSLSACLVRATTFTRARPCTCLHRGSDSMWR